MKEHKLVSLLFLVAALYDGVLGILFLFRPMWPFQWWQVTPPNHPGYVQFPAALLVVFALLFLRIAWCPASSRNLIPFGMLLKVSYCAIVFGYWFTTGVPAMWKPWAIADIVFLAAFAWAWWELGKARPTQG